MSQRYRKIYVREIKNRLGRFGVLPDDGAMLLGSIVRYHGRYGEFDPQGNLAGVGINVSVHTEPLDVKLEDKSDQRITTKASVNAQGQSVMTVTIKRKNLVHYEMKHGQLETLDLPSLRAALGHHIQGGGDWEPDWLIVTKRWVPSSFTLAIGLEKNVEVAFTATLPGVSLPFNIADPAIGLNTNYDKSNAVVWTTKGGTTPFFETHRLARSVFGARELKRYGR